MLRIFFFAQMARSFCVADNTPTGAVSSPRFLGLVQSEGNRSREKAEDGFSQHHSVCRGKSLRQVDRGKAPEFSTSYFKLKAGSVLDSAGLSRNHC